MKLLSYHGIDSIIDVGANNGGYGRLLRERGFTGSILSFEPLADAHAQLRAAAARSKNWHVAPRMALGAEEGEVEINVAGNSTSSSVLPMEERHASAAPQSRYVGVQRVPLRRLDDVGHDVIRQGKSILLKIDTQGYEMPVLMGAGPVLDRVCGLQLELSLAPLYDGQVLYREMMDWLSGKGFELWNVMPGFVDQRSGRMLQMDGVFFRKT
jgi:FkbM family methyltransferase